MNEAVDILVVDDDENINFALKETLAKKNFLADQAFTYLEAKEKIRFARYPMVITDVRMPDGNGIQLVQEIKEKSPQTKVIVITAFGTIEDAITAMKNGAEDYILKPFSPERLLQCVEEYFPEHFIPLRLSDFLTRDLLLEQMLEKVQKAALSNAPILIRGESGSGKEVLARFIHQKSKRNHFPYIAINCSAIPENLLESELFGYERGAFTGAEKFKPGKFELADKGTLVLDEIGDMPLHLQAKILRVLQEKEVDRLGGKKAFPVDVRIISLTNQEIEKKIVDKLFRHDLFYRLNVVEFHIPPLRERPKDIEFLTDYHIRLFEKELSKEKVDISANARNKLLKYNWPGNVRELQNVIHKAVIFCEKNQIREGDIEWKTVATLDSAKEIQTVAEMEKELILKTLSKTGGNRNRAAELLDISPRTLRNKLHDYNLERDVPPA